MPHVSNEPSCTTRKLLEHGLAMRAGIIPTDERVAERAEAFRHHSLVDVCREALRLAGIPQPTTRVDLVSRAFATLELGTVLTNVANKSLMLGFQESANTALMWCGETEEPDFKTASKLRTGSASELEEVNAHGEIPEGSVEDWAETYKLATYARKLTLTRHDVLNDDAEALIDQPKKMGAAARRKIDDLAYTHLLANGAMNDGTTLFHADRNNLNTSAALDSDTLSAARAAMRKQTDLDGETPLNIEPRFLIVPAELEHAALELVKSTHIVYGADNETKVGNKNVHYNTLRVVAEPRLSNASYTGYSATTWYLAASPMQADTIVVAYLTGQRQPTIEQIDPGPNVLGIGWRVYFDLAVKALDFRGMVKNTA